MELVRATHQLKILDIDTNSPFPFMLARLMELIHPLHQLPRHPCEKAPSFIRREKRVVSMEQATYIEIRLTGKKP